MTETATYRELRRSRDDRMLGGVCGGLGTYFNVNPAFYRVGFVVLALLGGAGIVIYGACLLMIPNEGEHDSIATEALRNHRERPAALVGLLLVVIAGIALLSHLSFRFDNDLLWVVALLVGAGILWSQRRDEAQRPSDGAAEPGPPDAERAPRTRRRSGLLALVVGGLAVGGGTLGLLEAFDVDVPWSIALGVAAVAVGAAVVAGAIARMRVGVVAAVAIVLALAAIASASVDLNLGDGIGKRSYAPATAADVRDDYRLGIGELEIDLGAVRLPPGQTRVEAHLGVGHMRIVVPRGVTVRAVTHVRYGEAILFGNHDDGRSVASEIGPRTARLLVEAHASAGQIEVVRAVR